MDSLGTLVLVLVGLVVGSAGVAAGWLSFWMLGLDGGLVVLALGGATVVWSLYSGYEFASAA